MIMNLDLQFNLQKTLDHCYIVSNKYINSSKFKVEIMNIEIPDLTIYDMEIQYSWFQDEF